MKAGRLDKKYLRIFVLQVKQNAREICECCFKKGSDFHAHHIVGRKSLVLRYLPINGIYLCPICHRQLHDGKLKDSIFAQQLELRKRALLVIEIAARKAIDACEYTLEEWIEKGLNKVA